MPIEPRELPAEAYETLHRELNRFMARREFSRSPFIDIPPGQLSWSVPHRMAILRRSQVWANDLVRARAVMTGWRVLLHAGEPVIAAVELSADDTGRYRLDRINIGPAAAGTARAIVESEKNAVILAGDFEPVFLLLPEMFVAALWLLDNRGSNDRFLPIPPVPREYGDVAMADDETFSTALVGIIGGSRQVP